MPTYKRLQAAKEAGTISPQEAAQLALYKRNLIQRLQMQLLYETGLNDVALLQVTFEFHLVAFRNHSTVNLNFAARFWGTPRMTALQNMPQR
jgi:hypothetical protein